MKDSCGKTVLTFGEFVVAVYAAWGNRRAPGLVQLAINAHLIEFLGYPRSWISPKEPPAVARSLLPGGPWNQEIVGLSHGATIQAGSLSASVSSGLAEPPTLGDR